jgi:dynein heavy chain 1
MKFLISDLHLLNYLMVLQVCYERVARGMLHTDRLTFELLLCRIHLKGVPNQPSLDQEFTFFLRGKEGMLTSKPPSMEGLSQEQLEALFRMSTRYVIFA